MSSALLRTVVGLWMVVLSGPGYAAGTPAQICAGAKLKATGKAAGAQVVCHAKATQKGIAVDPRCLLKADTRLANAFAKAEEKGGCGSMGDAGTIDALVDSSVGAFAATLRPVED